MYRSSIRRVQDSPCPTAIARSVAHIPPGERRTKAPSALHHRRTVSRVAATMLPNTQRDEPRLNSDGNDLSPGACCKRGACEPLDRGPKSESMPGHAVGICTSPPPARGTDLIVVHTVEYARVRQDRLPFALRRRSYPPARRPSRWAAPGLSLPRRANAPKRAHPVLAVGPASVLPSTKPAGRVPISQAGFDLTGTATSFCAERSKARGLVPHVAPCLISRVQGMHVICETRPSQFPLARPARAQRSHVETFRQQTIQGTPRGNHSDPVRTKPLPPPLRNGHGVGPQARPFRRLAQPKRGRDLASSRLCPAFEATLSR